MSRKLTKALTFVITVLAANSLLQVLADLALPAHRTPIVSLIISTMLALLAVPWIFVSALSVNHRTMVSLVGVAVVEVVGLIVSKAGKPLEREPMLFFVVHWVLDLLSVWAGWWLVENFRRVGEFLTIDRT